MGDLGAPVLGGLERAVWRVVGKDEGQSQSAGVTGRTLRGGREGAAGRLAAIMGKKGSTSSQQLPGLKTKPSTASASGTRTRTGPTLLAPGCDLSISNSNRLYREPDPSSDSEPTLDEKRREGWRIEPGVGGGGGGGGMWKGLIQRDVWRAPEVILGAGWDEKADMWAMGCVVRPFSPLPPPFLLLLPTDNGVG